MGFVGEEKASRLDVCLTSPEKVAGKGRRKKSPDTVTGAETEGKKIEERKPSLIPCKTSLNCLLSLKT